MSGEKPETHGVVPHGWWRIFSETDPDAKRLRAACQEMAPRYGGATVDQLVLAWIMAHPAQPMPVLGTTKVERVRSAAASVKLLLSKEDWYGLWEAAKGHRIP